MNRGKPTGFTLVEMLVAISLLGLLGIISWRGLEHVVDQRARITEKDAQIARLIRAIGQLERDVDERIADVLVVDPIRTSPGLPKSMAIPADEQSRERLTILRRHPDGLGAMMVVYRLEDERLVRYSGRGNDREPDRVDLLDGIASFQTRLLSPGGWAAVPQQLDSRATAIEISIERSNGERYAKVASL